MHAVNADVRMRECGFLGSHEDVALLSGLLFNGRFVCKGSGGAAHRSHASLLELGGAPAFSFWKMKAEKQAVLRMCRVC